MKTPQNRLHPTFVEVFGDEPDRVIRAPGRVNLIGDHTDYNGLPVFPMAIQRSVLLLVRTRTDDVIRVVNVDPRYEMVQFKLSPEMARGPLGSWENYVKAGPRALAESHGVRRGFDALITSDIPVAAGLSSSSALVVACGLAVCSANDVWLPVISMAELMANAERFVGTRGGGMDQAVCLGGRAGAAVRIDFAPLRLQLVRVPADWQFIVAHSLEQAEKSGSAQREYNERTTDCQIGLERLSRAFTPDTEASTPDYPTLMREHGANDVLAAAALKLTGRVRARVRHTVTEAYRVDRAIDAMRADRRETFGALMNESHASLRDDYEVSAPALDEVVDIMIAAGCDGARLTGAGFGGCAVGLCRADRVNRVQTALASDFYTPRGNLTMLDDLVFVAKPAAGATVASWSVGMD